MSEEQFNECEQAEALKHDEKLKELREEQQVIETDWKDLCMRKNKRIDELTESRNKLRGKVKDLTRELGAKEEVIEQAKEIIKQLHDCLLQDDSDEETKHYIIEYMTKAEQFLKEV